MRQETDVETYLQITNVNIHTNMIQKKADQYFRTVCAMNFPMKLGELLIFELLID